MAKSRIPAASSKEARKVKSEAIYVRCEPELVAALDEEAEAMSKAAGGASINRSEAARVTLRRGLAHRLKR
jgi:hypothetical protein